MDKPPSRIKTVRLPNDPFAQSNGYKPAPLDLTNITLSCKLEELIDHLAENTHNVWAKERITQGWTYGLNEVCLNTTQMKLFCIFAPIYFWASQKCYNISLFANIAM